MMLKLGTAALSIAWIMVWVLIDGEWWWIEIGR